MTPQRPPLVLVHGFAQSAAAWDEVRKLLPEGVQVRVPELPGHGRTGLSRGKPTVELARELVLEAIATLDQAPVVWGYSLGARVTFDLLLARPGIARAAIIESGTPGIENPADRDRRLSEDNQLSARLRKCSIEQFVAQWEQLPALGDQSPQLIAEQREMRLAQDPLGLAAALDGLGQAAYPSGWDRANEIDVPVLLLTGADDPVYEAHAARLAGLIPHARRESIPQVAHAVHICDPSAATDAALRFIDALQ